MSYCGFGPDSDVYLFNNGLRYCFTANHPGGSQEIFTVLTLELAITNLMRLREQGCKVPESAIERLRKEYTELVREMAGNL